MVSNVVVSSVFFTDVSPSLIMSIYFFNDILRIGLDDGGGGLCGLMSHGAMLAVA